MIIAVMNAVLGNRPLACTSCFPISDHVMPSWEVSFCFSLVMRTFARAGTTFERSYSLE